VRARHRGAQLRALEGQSRAADSLAPNLRFASSVARTQQEDPKDRT
jgi:hypothetical protein